MLGGEVGVAGVLPQTGGEETAVELCAGPAFGDFGGAGVEGFGGVVGPLLAVGEVLEDDEEEEGAGEEGVGCGEGGGEAGGEEEGGGWGCYGEEEDLVHVSSG